MADGAGLVIGYGSMGRRHAKALAQLTPKLCIVDAGEAERLTATRDYPDAEVEAKLDALDARMPLRTLDVAIIATWGPSHATLFDELVARGVRKVLCEKPLATSVAAADAMLRRAAADRVTLVSNHYFRNSGYVPALARLADAHDFGPPAMMALAGGAYCLATNGIHWLDVGMQLFGGMPETVLSTAHGDHINPRSKDLLHFDGSAIWHFADGRELTMAFSNRSSVHPIVHVYYRDGIVDIDDDFLVTLRRRPAEMKGRPVTRTGPATDVLFSGPLPGVMTTEDALRDGISRLITGATSLSPAPAAAAALNACVAALAAAREGRPLSLPLAGDGPWGREEWPIT